MVWMDTGMQKAERRFVTNKQNNTEKINYILSSAKSEKKRDVDIIVCCR